MAFPQKLRALHRRSNVRESRNKFLCTDRDQYHHQNRTDCLLSESLQHFQKFQKFNSSIASRVIRHKHRQTDRQKDQTRHTLRHKHNLLMASGAHSHSYKLDSLPQSKPPHMISSSFSLLRFTHCNILHAHNSTSSHYCT